MRASRRNFLQTASALAAAPLTGQTTPNIPAGYPKVYEGDHLKMLAFPLGGIGAGSLCLGGRGQLRDWEIFNRPDKGASPTYSFPSLYVKSGKTNPIVRVLEARLQPPFEGSSGLGSNNVPGLTRLAQARFTGEFPLARIDFIDPEIPVRISLDAFTPFIPHDAEASGLPVAILRYKVHNPGAVAADVAIAFSIENPVTGKPDNRRNSFRSDNGLHALSMTNPGLAAIDPMSGEFLLGAHGNYDRITHQIGWAPTKWWTAPMLFWDDFANDGELASQPDPHSAVGSLCLKHTIAPGKSKDFTFLLAWRFPNRTPDWMGWTAPKGDEKTNVGNHYAVRFASAWDAARYTADNLPALEKRTRLFAKTVRESTVPAAIKEAAMANLSTLVSTTCFRTADGEFHGFEGSNDHRGCCHGNCTHVWNYEVATDHLFPALARSLRKAAFGYSMDEQGSMRFRQNLPDGKSRTGTAAADGQMGQILHAYLDWSLSGDIAWLREMWPRIKQGLEFAWVPGGWDADRDGVMEGVQHNTYDVEFYGPNPMCGVYYLAALRAAEQMALAIRDPSAAEYKRLYENGANWIDANLFNGEFYIQKIRGFKKDAIAPSLRAGMGADDTENPQYQLGEGCLVDQLVGQYLADVCGLGPCVNPAHIRKTLESIHRYNYKRSLTRHESMQRTFALNDEAAMVICDYGKAARPKVPFPYYAEVMTGFEYQAAAHMIFLGMAKEGIECIASIRARYDGLKRNPWDEAECGHHYARAMAAWSGLLAVGGFRYRGQDAAVIVAPKSRAPAFRCFWSTATGWGEFTLSAGTLRITVLAGQLRAKTFEFPGRKPNAVVTLDGKPFTTEIVEAGQTVRIA